MPFTLPPIGRRHFVRGSLAALAGSLFSSREIFAKTESDPSSWILFSDTHIGADRALVSRNVNVSDNLAQCVKEALAAHSNAAGAFVSGDCALLNGQTADYENFGSLIKPMRDAGVPMHLMMGNHDDRANFATALSGINAPSPVEHRIVGIVESPLVNWFMLDSLDQTNKTPGWLREDQLTWLGKALDAHTDKPAIIVVHHNIVPLPEKPPVETDATKAALETAKQQIGKGGLQDAEELLAVLRPRKHAKACIFGHTHAWSVLREASGIHLINLPPTGYVFKQGMPNGWVHASLKKDSMTLQLNCVDPTHTQHHAKAELAWR